MTFLEVIGYKNLPQSEKLIAMEEAQQKNAGKYVAYMATFDGSTVAFADDIDLLKDCWCFRMEIFEGNGLTAEKLKELFPDKPPMGTIHQYLKENYVSVYKMGS
jgi:hypothetical protein